MTRKHILRSLAVVFFLASVLAMARARAEGFPNPLHLFGVGKSEPTPTAPAQAQAASPVAGSIAVPESFASIAHAAKPAVVNVSTTQTVQTQGFQGFGSRGQPGEQDPFSEFFRHFMPQMPRSYKQRSLGSGVIIGKDGYIVTNAHVVKDADKVVIKLEDQREFDAKVVGIDEKTDVALLKIQAPDALPFATLGNSDSIQVGDWVVAIGNPFGLSETVTAGIVSAKGRVIGEGPYDDFIQTDASINPGNSGGPLLNLQGRVIGINSAIFSRSGGNIGIGFAIPINLVKNVVDQLKAHGKVIRGWLGVSIQNITPDLAQSLGLKKSEGALVADVTPDSPASKAGLERGDVIVDYNGTHIDQAHQLPALVAATEIGKTASITVLRNGSSKTLSVTIAEMPANVTASAAPQSSQDWGLKVSNITPDIAQQLGLEHRNGVVITDVAAGSPAADAGLQPGDVIREVNREPIKNVGDYDKALRKADSKKPLLLLVEHQGQSLFLVLRQGE